MLPVFILDLNDEKTNANTENTVNDDADVRESDVRESDVRESQLILKIW